MTFDQDGFDFDNDQPATDARKCPYCGTDISHRHISAKKCESPECMKAYKIAHVNKPDIKAKRAQKQTEEIKAKAFELLRNKTDDVVDSTICPYCKTNPIGDLAHAITCGDPVCMYARKLDTCRIPKVDKGNCPYCPKPLHIRKDAQTCGETECQRKLECDRARAKMEEIKASPDYEDYVEKRKADRRAENQKKREQLMREWESANGKEWPTCKYCKARKVKRSNKPKGQPCAPANSCDAAACKQQNLDEMRKLGLLSLGDRNKCREEMDGKCIYCGIQTKETRRIRKNTGALEHIDSVLKGTLGDGHHNHTWACSSCNASKCTKDLYEWLRNGGNPEREMRSVSAIVFDLQILGKRMPPKAGTKISDDERIDIHKRKMVECPNCEKEFPEQFRRIYCSPKCAYHFQRRGVNEREWAKKLEKKCPQCGTDFTAHAPTDKFCSPACNRAWFSKVQYIRPHDGETSKTRYEERRANGLCGQCNNFAMPGKSQCESCAAKQKEYTLRGKTKRKANGLCTRCGEQPAMQGKSQCSGCIETARVGRKKLYEERKAAGLCVVCGDRADDGSVRCPPCAEKAKKKGIIVRKKLYAKRKAAGLCVSCGNPASDGFVQCLPCHNKQLKKNRS